MNMQRKTIFLVDDDITNLTAGKKALSASYNVFTLSSGALLLEMLENVMPDIILLDVNMPDLDGYETLKVIKGSKKTTDIPVIFLTSLNSVETELKGLSLGAVDYITKPFSPPLLLKRLELHLLVESQKNDLLRFNQQLAHLVEEKTATVVDLKNAILRTMAELVECRDEITGGHIERTNRYIKALIDGMKRCGIYEYEVSQLDENLVLQSCQLHDVGKISIRDSILRKPSKLDPEEFEEVKNHAAFGEKIILKLKENTADSSFLEYARIFAVSHHEKWDGSGYPLGLKYEEIPLLGRIMAIADVYDALVSQRPYKPCLSHEKAIKIILDCKGTHFDPVLIDLFKNIHSDFERIAEEVKLYSAQYLGG